MLDKVQTTDVAAIMDAIGVNAKAAAGALATASTEQKNDALNAMADLVLANSATILSANAEDLRNIEGKGLLPSFIDRLTLTEKSIAGMAERSNSRARR